MARKSNETNVIDTTEVDASTSKTLAAMNNNAGEHSLQVMDTYGEGLPYDRSRIVHEARFYMAQSAEAMLEAGKRLVILKEHEPHGDFLEIVETQLGIASRTAQQIMQAAIKYSSPKLASNTQAFVTLGKSKLFELMTEDDEPLAELAEGGTLAGLTLDDVERMSCRELKAALRSAKEDIQAKDQVISDKNKKIDNLATSIKKIKVETPDQELLQFRKEVAAIESDVESGLRIHLRSAFIQLQDFAMLRNFDQTEFLNSQIELLESAINQLRAELGIERTAIEANNEEWNG